jgi:glycosyltransferase involved in cell wall biosynthesis
MRFQLAAMARAADVVVADSRATANLAHRYLGVRKNCLRVVHAAAQSGFRPVPKEEARAAVAGRFGLPRDYLLAVGTIEPRKEHLTLMRALQAVPEAPLLVLVGGIGWKCRPILAQIRKQEAAGRVRYVGRVDDEWLPALYSAARLSVYPSLYEGFGLPVLEAMACGCPVLCSDSSSLPEVGGNAAAYFRTGDGSDLARKLRSLLSDEDRLTAMSVAGFARAGQFSFRRAAQEVLDIIRQGVAERR